MKNSILLALALSSVAALGCKKKEEEKKTETPTMAAKPGDTAKPAEPTPPTPPPAAADKEIDLSAWGPAFAGYVAMFRGVFGHVERIGWRESYLITMAGLAASREDRGTHGWRAARTSGGGR